MIKARLRLNKTLEEFSGKNTVGLNVGSMLGSVEEKDSGYVEGTWFGSRFLLILVVRGSLEAVEVLGAAKLSKAVKQESKE